MLNKTFLLVFCGVVGLAIGSRFSDLMVDKEKSKFSPGQEALVQAPHQGGFGDSSECGINGFLSCQCACKPGYVGVPPSCRPGPELWDLCFKNNHCGLYSECEVVNNTASCPSCLSPYQGTPPNCQPPQKCGKDINCSPNSEYENINRNPPCVCIQGFVGEPPNCEPGPALLALCDPYPCGGYSNCSIQDGHPKCCCLEGYEGEPPNCKPKPEMWRVCHKDKPCGYHSKCEMKDRIAVCSPCDEGFEGTPPNCYMDLDFFDKCPAA